MYRCSLSAIQIPSGGSGRRKMFFKERIIREVPWKSPQQMMDHVGFIQGEWKLSTNWVGHVQGLPKITGAIVARSGTKALIWRDDGQTMIINGSNWVGHYHEPKSKEGELHEDTSPVA